MKVTMTTVLDVISVKTIEAGRSRNPFYMRSAFLSGWCKEVILLIMSQSLLHEVCILIGNYDDNPTITMSQSLLHEVCILINW